MAAAWHRDAVSSLVLSSAYSPEAHPSLACREDGMACPLQGPHSALAQRLLSEPLGSFVGPFPLPWSFWGSDFYINLFHCPEELRDWQADLTSWIQGLF